MLSASLHFVRGMTGLYFKNASFLQVMLMLAYCNLPNCHWTFAYGKLILSFITLYININININVSIIVQSRTWHTPSPSVLPRTRSLPANVWTRNVHFLSAACHPQWPLSTCRTARSWNGTCRSSPAQRWNLGLLEWRLPAGLGTGWDST